MKLSRENIYHLCLLTILGFSFIGGCIVVFFHEQTFLSIFEAKLSVAKQLTYGLAYGIASALLALLIITRPFFKTDLSFFSEIVKIAGLTWYDILFFSLSAGVGEEILFRAAIQPWLGIWMTAILFVGLHGYLNPNNWRMSVYGFFMVIVSAGFGYLFVEVGLLSAMAAHFIIDVVLFFYLKNKE